MKKVAIKNVVKIIAFVLCATIIFCFVSKCFERKTYDGAWNYMAKLNEFYSMEEDSLDYIAVGSSHMYCSLNPLEVWKESGIAGFVLATQQQPLTASYHYIKEAFKTQSPKYVVLEGFMICGESTYDPAVLYDAVDPLKFSLNKIQMINNLVEYDERPNYYFNILKYHTRWNSMSAYNIEQAFSRPVDTYKGFVPLQGAFEGQNLIPDYEKAPDIQLSEFNLNILNDIYELVKENDAQLIIMLAPYDANSSDLTAKVKAMIKWAQQKDVQVLDYCSMLNEIKIDPACDYYDAGHLDISGAAKISTHFASYLKGKGVEKSTLINSEKWQADYNTYVNTYKTELGIE